MCFESVDTESIRENRMILDNLHTTKCDYGDMGVKLAKAFDWLRGTDLAKLTPDTSVAIDGERIYAQIQAYDTIDASSSLFETHRSYIDIQVVTRGEEIILWTPAAKLTKVSVPYDSAKDIARFEDPDFSVPLRMETGDFAVFFPTDGHKPRIKVDAPAPVGKIVVKVSV